MILSVIIPAYNESDYLGITLNKLYEAVDGTSIKSSDWEIIVCDNNSTDRTQNIAKQFGAKVIFEPENQISKARNKGAEIATGEWLLFMDADTYPDLNLMKDVIRVTKENKLIGCGSTIRVIDGSRFNRLRLERLNPLYRLLNLSGGAFILCKKTGFTVINGFSEDLYAAEEIDFLIKLKKYGKSVGK